MTDRDGPALGDEALVRRPPLGYAGQVIEEADIDAVVRVLRSPWLTTGPEVEAFEAAFAASVGSRHAVAFSSGTAALHGAASAAGLGPGDEAITTPLTFCATANCLVYQGARPVFADVAPDTLTLDPAEVARRIGPRTKAILPVHYAGHPADLEPLLALAASHGLIVIEDACHALGAEYKGRRIGSLGHLTVFSFHPVKHITTGEGGMVTTEDPRLADRLRRFRNHGIVRDPTSTAREPWRYDMKDLGWNYRLSDIACALGRSQLTRLEANLARRRQIAARYDQALAGLEGVGRPVARPLVRHAWHLYPIRLQAAPGVDRGAVVRALHARGLGVQVHYVPVHAHSYYRRRFGDQWGRYPVAERASEELLSLPMFHAMADADVEDVVRIFEEVWQAALNGRLDRPMASAPGRP